MEYLGDTLEQELSLEHATKEGVHDAVRTVVHYAFVGGVVLMTASLLLPRATLRKIAKRVTDV